MSKASKESIYFKSVFSSDPSLPSVIRPSIGSQTPEKIAHILQSYEEPDHFLIGGGLDHKLIAIIGFKVMNATAHIKHIVVINSFQRQGFGKLLVDYLINNFSLDKVTSETDEDSVGFYNSIGFVCTPFQSKHGVRYACLLELPKR